MNNYDRIWGRGPRGSQDRGYRGVTGPDPDATDGHDVLTRVRDVGRVLSERRGGSRGGDLLSNVVQLSQATAWESPGSLPSPPSSARVSRGDAGAGGGRVVRGRRLPCTTLHGTTLPVGAYREGRALPVDTRRARSRRGWRGRDVLSNVHHRGAEEQPLLHPHPPLAPKGVLTTPTREPQLTEPLQNFYRTSPLKVAGLGEHSTKSSGSFLIVLWVPGAEACTFECRRYTCAARLPVECRRATLTFANRPPVRKPPTFGRHGLKGGGHTCYF